MRISFRVTPSCVPPLIGDTKKFEDIYPTGLQVSLETKMNILSKGCGVWMFVNKDMVGELYGLAASKDSESIPDIQISDFYIGKITILPAFQGRGLGRLLFTYMLGMTRGSLFKRISLHATTEKMNHLSNLFGAQMGPAHSNWFNTGRTAIFRFIDL